MHEEQARGLIIYFGCSTGVGEPVHLLSGIPRTLQAFEHKRDRDQLSKDARANEFSSLLSLDHHLSWRLRKCLENRQRDRRTDDRIDK